MKLSILRNPYTATAEPVDEDDIKHVQFNIEETAWMEFYRVLPFHGTQDSFMATLFFRFMELSRAELPTGYDFDAEERVVELLQRLELSDPDTTPANPNL
tara:strand:- start:577 stop:876 length:300 start_codon:yes stop_codon:yes gene_type:complete